MALETLKENSKVANILVAPVNQLEIFRNNEIRNKFRLQCTREIYGSELSVFRRMKMGPPPRNKWALKCFFHYFWRCRRGAEPLNRVEIKRQWSETWRPSEHPNQSDANRPAGQSIPPLHPRRFIAFGLLLLFVVAVHWCDGPRWTRFSFICQLWPMMRALLKVKSVLRESLALLRVSSCKRFNFQSVQKME